MKQSLSKEPPIDKNLRRLVKVLNSFPGITTFGSCGGHPEPRKPDQWSEGNWYIFMDVARNVKGHLSLEFLAWAINHDMHNGAGRKVLLYPDSAPPYLNDPGYCLKYSLEGYGEDPEALASKLAKWKRSWFCDQKARQPVMQNYLMRESIKWEKEHRQDSSAVPAA